MSKITEAKIAKFIKIRNESPHQSNMQFEFDARQAGFSVADMPKPEKVDEGHYVWHFPFGKLVEQYGKLRLD